MDDVVAKKNIPKIRTFAADIAFARENKITPLVVDQPAKDSATKTLDKVEVEVKPRIEKAELEAAVKSAVDNASSKIKSASPDSDSEEATVITDTKHKRFRVLPAIAESLKNWFISNKKSIQKKKTPTYSVPEASLRKGVIQKATSKTGKATTADFASIQARIKKRKLEEEKEINTTWSANTEPVFLLLDTPKEEEVITTPKPITPEPAPIIQNVKVIPKRQALVNNPTVVVERVVNDISGPSGFESPEYLAKAEDVKVTPTKNTTAEAVVKESEPEEEVLPTITEDQNWSEEEVVLAESSEVTEAPKVAVEAVEPVNEKPITEKINVLNLVRRFLLTTNGLTLVIATIAIGVIFVGITFIFYPEQNTETVSEIPKSIAILNNSLLRNVEVLNLSQGHIISVLNQERQSIDRLTEISLSRAGQELPHSEVLASLNPKAEPSFTHSIKSVHFGYSSEAVPFVVMSFSDKAAVTGGMFKWEPNMPSELFKVFGITSTDSSYRFSDIQINGIDVRAYTDPEGHDQLIYGLVGSTVIITKDQLTFAALIPLSN